MTAVCSFVCHREVFDANIKSRIQTIVDRLTAEYENVEFLVHLYGDFSNAFLLAAMRAKNQYPQKVTVTLVTYRSSVDKMLHQEFVYSFMCDRVIMLDLRDKINDPASVQKRMHRWIVQNSTHLLHYFYDTLCDPDNYSVKGSETQEVISLTTPETEKAILKAATLMTEREQIVFQKVTEGCTLKEAGKAINVGGGRARQIVQHGCRTIRLELRRLYSKALAAEQQQRGPYTCGLFSLGESTCKSLTRFKLIIDFLISTYEVRDIYVEHPYISSGFLFVLTDPSCLSSQMREKMRITALMETGPLSENDDNLDAEKPGRCPPCHAVEYVSGAEAENIFGGFGVIADMIERMDFCICDLSSAPYAEKIKQYAAQTKRTILLDIGKSHIVKKGYAV